MKVSKEIRRVPSLRLELSKDGKSITIFDHEDKPHPFDCKLTDNDSRVYRKKLRKGLERMRSVLKKMELFLDGTLPVEVVAESFKDLNTQGLSILGQIFGHKQLSEVTKIFRRSFPAWDSSVEPLNITVVAELSRLVPIELLPIFDTSMWPPIDTDRDLERSIRRFPGFCAVIKREFTKGDVAQDLELKNEPKLPLRCFVNQSFEGLPAAAREFGFFKSNQNHIDLEGPWPPNGGLSVAQVSQRLANYLQFADEKFNGGPRSPIDQIQHFICHCDVDEEEFSESVLRLSDVHQIPIYQLQAEFTSESTRENPRDRPESAPLIFLNACESARIDPMAVTSFASFFLEDNNNRGFIGTEIKVPDEFAADFAQYFYRGLLAGLNLGEAIHHAKWSMLRNHKNPLGIIYTVYADPNMFVSNPVNI